MINSDHDSDIEEFKPAETAAERRQRAFANATAENMPRHSNPKQRQDWPKNWIDEWERCEELQQKKNEQAEKDQKIWNKYYKEEVEKARNTLEYAENYTWMMGKEAGNNIKQQFRKLWQKYSIDNINLPGSQMLDPWGIDVSTTELRLKAWTSRVQAIANARDILSNVNKFGFYHGTRPPREP